ncbi:MAG TPA: hypothetical protein VG367_12525 [Mucilaginibacter sp.]|jgi:hypothetical protein|nr:hypothetical protein [Mucilaginibacter sp.]
MEQKPKKQNVTKTFTKLALPMLACAVMLYSSCRKNENAPAPVNKTAQTNSTTTPTNSDLSKAIAINLAHSIGGAYGGVNLTTGVDSLSLASHLGPHNDFESPALCGLFTDSLVNFSNKQGDTTSHTGGNLTFYFNCDNGKPSGYIAYDSLATTRQAHSWYDQFYVKQAYTIKCLDDKHQFIGVNGDNYFYEYNQVTCGCGEKVITIQNCNFVLNNLTIDVCKKDILSGTATFTAYGEGWHVSGTLVFIGNHTANVTIGGDTFQINTLRYSW